MCLGKQLYRFLAALAPLFPARDAALCALEVQFGHAKYARVGDLAAIGEGSEGCQPQVDTGLLASKWQRLSDHLGTGEADIPAIRLTRDGDGLGCPFQR